MLELRLLEQTEFDCEGPGPELKANNGIKKTCHKLAGQGLHAAALSLRIRAENYDRPLKELNRTDG